MIEHVLKVGPVVHFFLIEKDFPAGKESCGISRLVRELNEKFPRCYTQERTKDELRKYLARLIGDETVKSIVSLTRYEVTISGYYMCYYDFCFVPTDGHWIV